MDVERQVAVARSWNRILVLTTSVLLGGLAYFALRGDAAVPRYVFVNGPSGSIYKMDATTGEAWWLVRDEARSVEHPKGRTEEERSIELAKGARSFGAPESNSSWIHEYLSKQDDPFEFLGWSAKYIRSGTILVSLELIRGGRRLGWYFEVLSEIGVVRKVDKASKLGRHYGIEVEDPVHDDLDRLLDEAQLQADEMVPADAAEKFREGLEKLRKQQDADRERAPSEGSR